MNVGTLCTLDTICCTRDETVQGAALLMRKHHVAHIGDVYATIERMRLRGIRRVPVVGEGGCLAGIVSADDLLGFLAEEMETLARISPHQQSQERRARQ